MRLEAMDEHNGAPRRAPLRPFLRDAVGILVFFITERDKEGKEKVSVLNTWQAICFTICKQSETNIAHF